MFLTRFRLNTARVGARRLLSSPQVLHAAVMASFAEAPSHGGHGPRVLWRIDRNSKAETLLYVVSPVRPDLTHLVEQAGWPATPTAGWKTYDYADFLSKLAAGDTWSFRLTANPVHSIRRKDGEPTKRTAHVTPRHQKQWLIKHQENAGFRVLERPAERQVLPDGGDAYELIVHDRRDLAFGKTEQPSGRLNRVTLATATFDGRLAVTDPDALRRTLTSGLGKAKAYGCGLMTLAPAR
ncbi:type I-E CRISPR-associated protein Cas6/Cse3/CasE [Streptomyces specialis]|uniref:type I-E CRISPR-associated protein Cas6/Cse3/CasE n=1 Tax=Streptomyces specialis TaxID=498367 RepID=UPI00073E412A|nr:type I-E CRISPR-associated protein Cas6/Cse3/CasE [Streptomyces specialis]